MKRLSTIIVSVCLCLSLSGADFHTGYFSRTYPFVYKLNPAFHPDRAFVAIPALGGTSASYQSDLGLGNLLYPHSSGLVTFLHPDVSADEFLGSLNPKYNRISVDATTNIFAIGIKKDDLYNTIDLSVRATADGVIPYEMFRFLKTGTARTDSYDLSGLRMHASSFVELGFGSSFTRGDLTIGTRLKGLVGLADFKAAYDKLNVKFDGQQWAVSAIGTLTGAYDGIKVKTTDSMAGTYSDIIDFGSSRYSARLGVNGVGVSADFGLKYVSGKFELSASLTDFGMMWCFNNIRGYTNNKWTFEGKKDIQVSGGGGTIGDEISDAADELMEVFQLRKRSSRDQFRMQSFTVRAGANCHVSDPLSVGLMGSFRYSSVLPVWECRSFLNWNPFKCLELVGSCAVNTYGFAPGVMLNFHVPGVTLSLGADNFLIGKFSPQGIPIDGFNGSFLVGLAITW